MKKILLLLFLAFSTFTFSNWEVIELVDEFKDKTGNVAIISDFKESGFIRLSKLDDGTLAFSILPKDYIGGKGQFDKSEIKVKIDQNAPIILNGTVSNDGERVTIFSDFDNKKIFPKFLEEMKNGEIMKISIEKHNSNTILRTVELSDFNEK